MFLKTKSAFTLVELIVVITILLILSTISFISLIGYSKDARNAKRISDISTLRKGLELGNLMIGTYFVPENFKEFSGGLNSSIKQGEFGNKLLNKLKIGKNVFDPLTKEKYIYSLYGNGKYYQIGYNLEKRGFHFSANNKITKVEGSYLFDPSLPSLLVVDGSVNSNGIFDSNVCFIVDGGQNYLNSNVSNCIKKKDMILKKFDKGLLGYWDMETLNLGKLKDLSGNGNDGNLIGGINIGGTLGIFGKSSFFNGINNFVELGNKQSLALNEKFSISVVIKDTGNINKRKTIIGGDCADWIFSIDSLNRGIISRQCGDGGLGFSNIYLNTKREIGNGNWKKLTIVKNKKNVKIYLNGILKNKTNNFDAIFTSGRKDIGASGGVREFFEGIIDEIKIYNRELSQKEIMQQGKVAGF